MPHAPFRGAIPDDRLYDPRHDMWVQHDGSRVRIGATSFGLFLAGEIIAFTAKPVGAEVDAGRGLGTVECAKTVLAVRAPVALTIETINEALEEAPTRINADPWAHWMVGGTPRDWAADAAGLIDAEAYRAHIRRIEPEAELA